jgi:8-oxo-dGTP diphosphatase
LSDTPASIYVVRHARAQARDRWSGDDRRRPLTKSGRRRADALAALLLDSPIQRILSSPYRRCLETVAPLAQRRGVPVETSPDLAEGADQGAVLALIGRVEDGSVLCSHGDVILAMLEHLAGQGVLSPAEVHAEKGSIWLLKRVEGHVAHARHIRASV